MKFSSESFALVAAVFFVIPSQVEGQLPTPSIDIVERVVAVIGDSMISMTELEQSLLGMEARGWARPTGPAELLEAKLELLEQMINQQLIIQEAAKDTLQNREDTQSHLEEAKGDARGTVDAVREVS